MAERKRVRWKCHKGPSDLTFNTEEENMYIFHVDGSFDNGPVEETIGNQ